MAEGALHPTTVLFPILMAHQAESRAPLGQTSLVWAAVANRARGDVSQVSAVVPPGVFGMAKSAVYGGLVMKGVTACAHFPAPSRAGTLVAGGATKAHGRVGSMKEAPRYSHEGVLGHPFVAEAAVHGGCVVEAMASDTRLFLHRHGGSLVAGVTTESHGEMGIVEEAPGGK